jgi:DNA mismatch endonuclease, patch repair protein
MPDVFTKAKRSEVMSRIRGRGNKDTELALVRLLRAYKISGWRRHARVAVAGSRSRVERRKRLNPQLSVRPDFVFLKLRTVMFVDGCFWHGCPKHATKPENNRAFWRRTFSVNKKRDGIVNRTLRKAGWRVLRIWEHELARKHDARLVRRIWP